jgi:hypothetical protein
MTSISQPAGSKTPDTERDEALSGFDSDPAEASPPEKLSTLAGEYIGLTLAGGLLVGLVAGVLLPRARKRKAAKAAAGLASSAGELGLALATKALARAGEAVRETRDKAADVGELVKDHAVPAFASAGRLIGEGADKARDTGATLARKAADIVEKVQSRS